MIILYYGRKFPEQNQLVPICSHVERRSHCLNITLRGVHLDGLPLPCLHAYADLQGCRGVCPKREDHRNRATES